MLRYAGQGMRHPRRPPHREVEGVRAVAAVVDAAGLARMKSKTALSVKYTAYRSKSFPRGGAWLPLPKRRQIWR